jgi:hypothetical protein
MIALSIGVFSVQAVKSIGLENVLFFSSHLGDLLCQETTPIFLKPSV